MSTILARGLLTFEFPRDLTVEYFKLAFTQDLSHFPSEEEYHSIQPTWDDTGRACIHLDPLGVKVGNSQVCRLYLKIEYYNGQVSEPEICDCRFKEAELARPKNLKVIHEAD